MRFERILGADSAEGQIGHFSRMELKINLGCHGLQIGHDMLDLEELDDKKRCRVAVETTRVGIEKVGLACP